MSGLWNKFVAGLVLTLSLPTALIIVTWKSLPGDFDYPIKLAMEQALLFVAKPSLAAAGNLGIRFTQRRSDEALALLSQKQSGGGLIFLANQIGQTRDTILGAKRDDTQDALAREYIEALQKVSDELEAQKSSYVAANAANLPPEVVRTLAQATAKKPSTSSPTTTRTNRRSTASSSYVSPQQPAAPATTTTTRTVEEHIIVVTNITHTQEIIKETIVELERVKTESAPEPDQEIEQENAPAGQSAQPTPPPQAPAPPSAGEGSAEGAGPGNQNPDNGQGSGEDHENQGNDNPGEGNQGQGQGNE